MQVGHSWPTSANLTGKSAHPACVNVSLTTRSKLTESAERLASARIWLLG
ncbi:hypothetical protein RESH_04762 [Rhodopirellula europaea SH398]|uniref:Uncharacterized protein n=1 Tax=Rhodopirellula europaea SH398 TaxID=1263868 RepID=M5RZ72_9BACT|nr:hypothetical protein RESH_04762 [Rhodopirellula europaea SH398]